MAFPQNTASCIQYLYPESKIDRDWVVTSRNSVIEIEKWNTNIGTKPTEDEINAVSTTLENQWDAQAYSRKREAEYPSVQECIHAILDNDNNELDTLQAKRAEIKLKYPKGG
jgi:hypothetical protein